MFYQCLVMFSGDACDSNMIFGMGSNAVAHADPVSGEMIRSQIDANVSALRMGHWPFSVVIASNSP